ncbi:chromosome segregation ATPase [Cryptosporidium felis]|nr:chromosome segregation ATPase [Cryptosporidium felis]
MDLNDVNATVKTAFCNTQVAEAFAAAVVASSKGKDNIIKDSYDLEIQKLNNELKRLKDDINNLQTSFIGNLGTEPKSVGTAESRGENQRENPRSNKQLNYGEWEILQKYIYEHFEQQARTESKIKDLEDSIVRDKENLLSRKSEIDLIEKNLEASTEQITTLVYLISEYKEKINSIEERINILQGKVNSVDEKLTTNLQILDSIAEIPDSLMNTLSSQSESWNEFRGFLKQLSKEVDYFVKRNIGSFDENNCTDELGSLLKKLIDAMQQVQFQPITSVTRLD